MTSSWLSLIAATAQPPASLVPATPSTAPDYYCTWNLQGYVCSYGAGAGSNDLRLEINEDNLFGEQLDYKVWGREQPKATLTSGQPPREVIWTVPARYQGWLQEGTNIIYYGNENGTAPDLDKITVTPTWATQQASTDAVQSPTIPLANFEVQGSTLTVNSLSAATLHVFSLDGRVLHTEAVPAGSSQVSLRYLHGPVILSLNTGVHSFARKIILH